jgi:hypothetical protein
MADGGNAESLKIFGSEMAQFFSADVILAECRLISFKTKASQPACDIHRRFPGSVTLTADYHPVGTVVSRNRRYQSRLTSPLAASSLPPCATIISAPSGSGRCSFNAWEVGADILPH